MKAIWVPLICLSLTAPLFPQTKKTPSPSRVIRFKTISLPVLEDEHRNLRFDLKITWDFVPKAGGIVRYLVDAFPPPPLPSDTPEEKADETPEKTAAFVTKAHACTYFLVLYDREGFKLLEEDLQFARKVDDDGYQIGMTANSSAPMSHQTFSSVDRWDILWNCSK